MSGEQPGKRRQRVVLLSTIEVERELAALRAGLAGLDLEVVASESVPSGPGTVALVALPMVQVSARHARALPDLRIVCAASTGVDHLDVSGLQRLGCVVTNATGHSDVEVADHTTAMVFALLRDLLGSDTAVRSGVWDARSSGARRIAGTSLGLVGFGPIARLVARRTVAMGMVVRAWSRSRTAGHDSSTGVEFVSSFTELLEVSQVVSLHVPATPQTRHLMNDEALAVMPDGSYLINCSRGSLVDVEALGRALRSGKLSAAALDVLEPEPPGRDHPALTLPRVLLTPHLAWFSQESATASYEMAAANIRRVLSGTAAQEVA